jgi:hypothetical protein
MLSSPVLLPARKNRKFDHRGAFMRLLIAKLFERLGVHGARLRAVLELEGQNERLFILLA